MKNTRFLFTFLIVAMIGVSGLSAQSAVDQQSMASQLRNNQEEIQNYSWNSKYTYKVNGVQRRVDEYTVKFFPDGTQQKMQVGSSVAKEKVRGADGKKLSKKQRQAAYDFAVEVKSQLDSYLNPLFSEKAVTKGTMTTSENTLTIQSADVVSRGDTVNIRYSLPSRLPISASVKTNVEGSPVSLEIDFATPEVGPSFPKRSVTTTTWNGLLLEITAENSNYQRTRR